MAQISAHSQVLTWPFHCQQLSYPSCSCPDTTMVSSPRARQETTHPSPTRTIPVCLHPDEAHPGRGWGFGAAESGAQIDVPAREDPKIRGGRPQCWKEKGGRPPKPKQKEKGASKRGASRLEQDRGRTKGRETSRTLQLNQPRKAPRLPAHISAQSWWFALHPHVSRLFSTHPRQPCVWTTESLSLHALALEPSSGTGTSTRHTLTHWSRDEARMQGGDPSQRDGFMHLERAVAHDIQTLIGRQTGSLQSWKRTERLDLLRTLMIPRVVQPQVFPPSVDTPWIQPHWATTGIFPVSINSQDMGHSAYGCPKAKAPHSSHPHAPWGPGLLSGPPLPAVQPLVGLVAKVSLLFSLPARSLQAGPRWAQTRFPAAC